MLIQEQLSRRYGHNLGSITFRGSARWRPAVSLSSVALTCYIYILHALQLQHATVRVVDPLATISLRSNLLGCVNPYVTSLRKCRGFQRSEKKRKEDHGGENSPDHELI